MIQCDFAHVRIVTFGKMCVLAGSQKDALTISVRVTVFGFDSTNAGSRREYGAGSKIT